MNTYKVVVYWVNNITKNYTVNRRTEVLFKVNDSICTHLPIYEDELNNFIKESLIKDGFRIGTDTYERVVFIELVFDTKDKGIMKLVREKEIRSYQSCDNFFGTTNIFIKEKEE